MNVIAFVTGKDQSEVAHGAKIKNNSLSAIKDANGFANYYDVDLPSICSCLARWVVYVRKKHGFPNALILRKQKNTQHGVGIFFSSVVEVSLDMERNKSLKRMCDVPI